MRLPLSIRGPSLAKRRGGPAHGTMWPMALDLLLPVRRTIDRAYRVVTDPLAYVRDPGRRPTDHPTVGMVGYYGWGNYGDELFERAFRQELAGSMDLQPL